MITVVFDEDIIHSIGFSGNPSRLGAIAASTHESIGLAGPAPWHNAVQAMSTVFLDATRRTAHNQFSLIL